MGGAGARLRIRGSEYPNSNLQHPEEIPSFKSQTGPTIRIWGKRPIATRRAGVVEFARGQVAITNGDLLITHESGIPDIWWGLD
jgi:hypothetical protein